jgi:hypothetical protein
MQLKDWFYNGYSRDELASIFLNWVNRDAINSMTTADIAGWGRCRLAHELEILSK